MSMASIDLGGYTTPEDLARGKRKVAVSLVVAIAAAALSVLASRATDNPRLVVVYLAAGALHFTGAVFAAVRWSRTPDFGTAG